MGDDLSVPCETFKRGGECACTNRHEPLLPKTPILGSLDIFYGANRQKFSGITELNTESPFSYRVAYETLKGERSSKIVLGPHFGGFVVITEPVVEENKNAS